MEKRKWDNSLIIAYIVLIVLTRTVIHIAPNVEFVTAASIAAGYFFYNKKLAYLVPLIGLVLTDMMIGNTMILLFTWSAYLIAPLAGQILRKSRFKKLDQTSGLFTGIGFTLFFFLWTNLGVVLTTNMYTKDLPGLLFSYYSALPFLIPQLIGNVIFVPILFQLTSYLHNKLSPQIAERNQLLNA